MSRRILLSVAFSLLAGCKIVQTSTSGGSIVSASGRHDCPEDSVCDVDVPNGERFSETFVAVANNGYVFAGWRGSESYLCAGVSPTCVVDIPASVTVYDATGFMTAEFYHEPELVYAGTLGVEWSVWSGDVEYEHRLNSLFVADFDADGDDDVMLDAPTHPPGPVAGAREGVILINNGGYSFTPAAGDGPEGIHAREVLMADFNGDGNNDFFIADHGYDEPPFPGWSNQLLLWTVNGYADVSDRLPPDTTGYTHNAAVGDVDGDGDVDILVANTSGDFSEGPYFLLNDGAAQFTVDTERLPERVQTDQVYFSNAVELADLDGDGHVDLLMGANDFEASASFIYWGDADGEFRDNRVTELPTPEFLHAFGIFNVISTAVRDLDGDGRPDVVLGGYDDELHRGMQLLVNTGDRQFLDQTRRRVGHSAWSLTEFWHLAHVFLDFNADGTLDIVPQGYDTDGSNVVAWLNDGTGHYLALKSTLFPEAQADALLRFAAGVKVREGSAFKSVEFFHSPGSTIGANAGVVLADPAVTLAE